MLICLGDGCRCAVSPAAIADHLRRKHKVQLELRKQVERYIEGFPFIYNYSTVQLPLDRSAPQPVIEVVDGFQCQHCQQEPHGPYKTKDRSNARKHGNKVHDKKRVADEDLFDSVKLCVRPDIKHTCFIKNRWVLDPGSAGRSLDKGVLYYFFRHALLNIKSITRGSTEAPEAPEDGL